MWGSGRLAVAPDSSAECTVCAHSLLLPPGTRSCVQSQVGDLCTQPHVSKQNWMKHKGKGGEKKKVRLYYPDPIFISQELLVGFAGTKLVISPPEVFIYLPKSKNPGSFLFFPEGEFVYIREKNFFSLSHKGRMGVGNSCSSSS